VLQACKISISSALKEKQIESQPTKSFELNLLFAYRSVDFFTTVDIQDQQKNGEEVV
jgi:hypothetical protein